MQDPSTLDRLWVQHLEGLCQRVCRACAARVQRICSVSAACLQATEIPGDRDGTAVALGLAWILPNARLLVMSQTLRLSWHDKPLASKFILLASDYFEMAVLEMGSSAQKQCRHHSSPLQSKLRLQHPVPSPGQPFSQVSALHA